MTLHSEVVTGEPQLKSELERCLGIFVEGERLGILG